MKSFYDAIKIDRKMFKQELELWLAIEGILLTLITWKHMMAGPKKDGYTELSANKDEASKPR